VEVHEATDGTLELTATGPVGFEVRYDLAPAADGGSEVRARVCIRPGRGLLGRLLEHATAALLSAGALDTAVSRIGREAAVCA
jgi:hypothetical protein